MIAGGSTPRLPPASQQLLQASYQTLYLPWLCPALHTATLRQRHTFTPLQNQAPWETCGRTIIQPNRARCHYHSARRGLASAAVATPVSVANDYVPFETASNAYPDQQSDSWSSKSSDPLWVFDPKAPMILDSPQVATISASFRAHKGVSGELSEIHQTLHACLQVGRLDRAVALIKRLGKIYKPDAPGLLAAHNDYLRELVYRAGEPHDKALLKDVRKWFEVDMRRGRVPPNATTYALMVQASLREPDASGVGTSARRYLDMAEEEGCLDEVTAMITSLLHKDELEMLSKILDQHFQSFDTTTVDTPNVPLSQSKDPRSLNTDAMSVVKPMTVKGLGLQTLRRSLSLLTDGTDSVIDDTDRRIAGEGDQNSVERQRLLERNTYAAALDRWREESEQQKSLGINAALSNSSIGAMMWDWHEKLVPRIREEIEKGKEAETKKFRNVADTDRCYYGPYLQYLSPERLSAVVILTTMNFVAGGREPDTMKLTTLIFKIADQIQNESIAETLKHNSEQARKRMIAGNHIAMMQAYLKLPRSKSLAGIGFGTDQSITEVRENLQWSGPVKVKIGSLLLWHLMEVSKVIVASPHPGTRATLTETQPAFFHTFIYSEGKRIGMIRLNATVASKIAKEPVKSLLSKNLPMTAPPKPWTDFQEGGYYEHPLPVVRIKHMDLGRQYAKTACSNGDMAHMFAGLDVLGRTGWHINRPVLEAMIEAWNTGEQFAKIPPEDLTTESPPQPSNIDNYVERTKWIRQLKLIENFKNGQRTQRCFLNYQLEIARAFVNETFYFPHNLDFRGRAYPMSPLFNHMGADNCRGLLLFARGKELGEKGLSWLKIHLASLYGYDKASFTEREDFTTEHLHEIYDSATNPIHGRRWWLAAEDPWQCLAACVELKRALDSPDPHRFVSHLPIHQDGTCNGLQHYAALGGDSIGAKQVNLEPGERPSDIYTAVAELVNEEVCRDAANGDSVARLLEGQVKRKIVKPTVMTNVYGVTFMGAKLQVRRQLEDSLKSSPTDKGRHLDQLASYIAKKIFKALSSMFTGAHDIQYWLGDCANRISQALSPEEIDAALGNKKSKVESPFIRRPRSKKAAKADLVFKTPVIWTNPLKMPIVQPYRAETPQHVKTHLQAITLQSPSPLDPVSKRKQFQAFPPNFVHSLDASHMILTALKCHDTGLTFASVHDSFWTHAADIEHMNSIIRDQFIRMHSEDVVGRLATEFAVRYKNYIYMASVKSSSAVGKKIRAWRRLDRPKTRDTNRKLMELKLEKQRSDLLASDNAEEREKGLMMVTPAQIFQTVAKETDLVPEESLEVAGIGDIPTSRVAKLQTNEQLEVGDPENLQELDVPTANPADASLSDPNGTCESQGEAVAQGLEGTAKPKPKRACPKTWFWLPMTFPPPPRKGDFDVTRLRKSQYFFS